jgi:TolA-binding protein
LHYGGTESKSFYAVIVFQTISGVAWTEVRRKLKEAQQAAEELASAPYPASGEGTESLHETEHELRELQGKFEQLSSDSVKLQRQLENHKELKAELSDNQVVCFD